ncbi:ribosome-associated translation inhibitor RaiA [Candidatus Microgenomates bacterium]|nr:ribosome-associated translation inhibitor RaiA [Candidatus Microgenomates bacterium]
MIKLEISAVHFELDEKLKRYVTSHIGKLDRYVPKSLREPLMGRVILTENSGAAKERCVCEVSLSLPKEQLVAQESTPNSLYAAIDLAEDKMRIQLLKYKTKVTDSQSRWRRAARRLRFRRRS